MSIAPIAILVTSETQKEGILPNPSPKTSDVICGEGLCHFRLPHVNIYYYIPKITLCKLTQTLPCETARKRTILHITLTLHNMTFAKVHRAVRTLATRSIHLNLEISIQRFCHIEYLHLQIYAKSSCFYDQPSIEGSPIIYQLRNSEQPAIQFLNGDFSAPTGYGVQPFGHTTAGAWRQNSGIVAGSVTDQRHGIGTDGCQHQLPVFSIRQNIPLFIDDLWDDGFPAGASLQKLSRSPLRPGRTPGCRSGDRACFPTSFPILP